MQLFSGSNFIKIRVDSEDFLVVDNIWPFDREQSLRYN